MTEHIKNNMNLHSRVLEESAGRRRARTFDRFWRARNDARRPERDAMRGIRQRIAAGRPRWSRERGRRGPARAARRGRGRTRDKEKRRDPGQVPPLSGPTWEGRPGGPAGKGGVEMRWLCEGAAFGAVTLSMPCGRWPQPQNDARRWWRRVRDVEMPWSGGRPHPVATGAADVRAGPGASWRGATRGEEVSEGRPRGARPSERV